MKNIWIVILFFACTNVSEKSKPENTSPITEEVVERYDNGVIKVQGRILNGERDGKWVYFYETGIKWSEGQFKNGLRTGPSIVYYESGKKKLEGKYEKNKKVGKWKVWEEDGTLAHIVNMDSLMAGQDSIIKRAESTAR